VPRIKKAYRTKALELHPDRNYGSVDSATKKFAEVQSAYQVLSDPQERAWYDSHRDAILQNFDPGADGNFERGVQLTSAGDIVRLISNFSTSMPFTDNPNGFFGIFRSTFATLAKEEATSCDWEGLEVIKYPSFGNAKDSYENVVKPFYAAWIGFATKKTFSWKDTYRCTEAPDRRIRRLMEKKNKKLRDEGVREFNDAVRSLVRFVRKRDPRYVPNFQSEADRQKNLRDAATAQAARSRAVNQSKLDAQSVPKWAQTGDVEEAFFSEPDQSDEDRYECVACAKVFKSENQYNAHEKSKKHIKAIRDLRKEMQRENKRLDVRGEVSVNGNTTRQTDSRHGSSSSHVEKMQDSPLAEGTPLEYSDANCNITGASAHVDSENETNVFREIGIDTWGFSAPEDILDGDSEIDDKSRELEECRLSSLTIKDITLQMIDSTVHNKILTPSANSIANNFDGEQPQTVGKAKTRKVRRAVRDAKVTHGDLGVRNIIVPSPHQLNNRLILILVQMHKMQPAFYL
jgi:DnaJ homolog subfamily A member 5